MSSQKKSFDEIPREILDSLTRFDMPVVGGIDPAEDCLKVSGVAVPIYLSKSVPRDIRMEYFHINALLAAAVYSVSAVFSKAALMRGCGIMRLSFIMNLVFAAVFVLALSWQVEAIPMNQIHLPLLTGLFFFIAHVFTFAAIRMGDVSLQTPVMGTKAVFVAVIAVVFGLEEVTWSLGVAAVLAALAVALLGFSGGQARRVGLTVGLSLCSALFFAGSDQMVGVFGEAFGKQSFLIITMLFNAALSFTLIPFFNGRLSEISQSALPLVLIASLGMALQALLLNYTLADSGEVVAINILYSARGFFSVLIGLGLAIFFTSKLERVGTLVGSLRMIGALLISCAIVIVLTN